MTKNILVGHYFLGLCNASDNRMNESSLNIHLRYFEFNIRKFFHESNQSRNNGTNSIIFLVFLAYAGKISDEVSLVMGLHCYCYSNC